MTDAIAERDDVRADAIPDALLRADRPVVLRGLVTDWPMVQAARAGSVDAATYLAGFVRPGAPPVTATVGPPEIEGRFFYSDDLLGFNFRREEVPLDVALRTLVNYLDAPAPPAIYVASTTIDTWLPGFRDANVLALGGRDALASIWIGNRTRIAAHQDLPDNLACVVAGRRRVTLFPPEQLPNLYIGPLDLTPAGQPISLVDFAAPDIARFPRFAEALQHAQVAELEPGDAVLIPSMWWHHMEGLTPFNVLVNYWWRQSPAWMDTPMNALMLALMTVRDLPPAQRAIWRDVFDHYVFEPGAQTADHVPEPARNLLSPLDEARARRLRQRLLQRLNR
ncbi:MULTISPECIES: cupin-like domain-containing protein [Luteimonas]|uniref:cupin-like domain-containing protein n=1 Tax=Luteimonas TaxID=83614 RepID=UPI000C7B8CB3|nr:MULTISPECIES: cupin-like domain-containing protein [Luteimonas]